MRKKKTMAVVSGLCAALAISGLGLSAYAAYQAVGSARNYITTPASFGAKIVENYEKPTSIYPGDDIPDEIAVSNTGTVPELVRVSLKKQVGHKGEDGTFAEDMSFDIDQLSLNTDTEHWVYRDDGYYYYKQVLEPAATTEDLLKSISLSNTMANDWQGVNCQVAVNAETIQTGDAAEKVWGVSMDDLGIAYEEPTQEVTETTVTFLGQSEGFDISLSDTDLFANFKGVLPGTSRSQTIRIKNSSKDTVTIGMNAMELWKEDTSEAVSDMMTKYATITVTDSEGNTVYDGPAGGQGTCDISFGTFEPGIEKELAVTLSMSSDMDVESQNLSGSVTWQFQAEQIDELVSPTPEEGKPTATPTKTPNEPKTVTKQHLVQTSDAGILKLGISLLIVGFAGYEIVKLTEKRGRTS